MTELGENPGKAWMSRRRVLSAVCTSRFHNLTPIVPLFTLKAMEVHFTPETESRLQELASKSGRPTDDLVEDAMAGYLAEAAELREMLDSRYDDIKSGKVKPIDGEEAFERLRRKSHERRASHS